MANKQNLVAKLYGKEDLKIESHPIPKPSRGEVLLALKRCGMCATDLHLWQQGGGPGLTIQDFIIIGHECSGIVVAVGEDVTSLKEGPVGLCCVMSAKSAGASEICVTDVDTSKLELATQLGATHTVRVTGKPEETAIEVKDVLDNSPDVALECSGVESALTSAIRAVRPGGVVTVVSIYARGDVTIPVTDISVREVDLRGVFSYCKEDYQAAIAMVASGSVDPSPMISHRFTLPNVLQAIELLRKRERGVVKIMVDVEAK